MFDAQRNFPIHKPIPNSARWIESRKSRLEIPRLDRKFSAMKTAAQQQTARQKTAVGLVRARRKRGALVVKDWRKGIGKLQDTPMAREADALGEQWRRTQTNP